MAKGFKTIDAGDKGSVKIINSQIDAIVKAGSKLQVMVHQAAVNCLIWANVHGDVTLMDRLVKASPTAIRKNAIIAWAVHFGPFTYDAERAKKDKDACAFNLDKKRKGKALVKEACEVSPHDFEPEKAYKPFDLVETLQRLSATAKARAKKGEKADNIPVELLGRIDALLAEVKPANNLPA